MAGVEIDDEELNKLSGGDSGFTWENRYVQSWEILQEDAAGTLQPTLAMLVQRESEYLHRRRLAVDKALRRGIMRHMVILIDWSIAAASTEVSPNRGVWTIQNAIKPLVKEFFDQNPLGQVAILALRDGLAERVSDISPNLVEHEAALDKLIQEATITENVPRGALSLQNGLQVAQSILCHVPNHGTREIILLQIGLASHDSGNIFECIPAMTTAKIRFSAISMCAEVAVARRLAKETNGSYGVALSDAHFVDLAMEQLSPPVLARDARTTSYLVQMGFPLQIVHSKAVLCACHGEAKYRGYQCPRCQAFLCQLPMDCVICCLTLISAPHLAKSYHHLFPVATFEDIDAHGKNCSGCQIEITDELANGFKAGSCPRCNGDYCARCNQFIHSILYNCPTCL
jgi:transcription initiation factor TFIIH subunit 2